MVTSEYRLGQRNSSAAATAAMAEPDEARFAALYGLIVLYWEAKLKAVR